MASHAYRDTNSWIYSPFPIRADEFGSTSESALALVPALHLFFHTHTDHILGLSVKSFASTVIYSANAKEMLLRHVHAR